MRLRWSRCALASTCVYYHICNHSVFHSFASSTDSFPTASLFGLPNKCTSNCHRSCCQCEQSACTRRKPRMVLACTFVLCWHGSKCAAFGCEQQLIQRCRISNQSVPYQLQPFCSRCGCHQQSINANLRHRITYLACHIATCSRHSAAAAVQSDAGGF